jgi:hypothetical protein
VQLPNYRRILLQRLHLYNDPHIMPIVDSGAFRISRFIGEWGQEIVPASAMVPQFTLAEVASRLRAQGFPFKRSDCFSDAQRVALSLCRHFL